MFFPDARTFFELTIGSATISIKWYAVLILLGALLAYYFSKKEFKAAKYVDNEFFDSLFVYTLWIGILGARIWFCVFYDFAYYMSNPAAIIRIWDGGLAIQGGIVFGAIFAYIYIKAYNYSFLKILDMLLPNVLLGQCIGRWGNFINQECHGGEVLESYFDGILFFLKDGMYINGHYYEPLFFYESILCLLGWLLIYYILRKFQNKRGDLTYAYLMWYGLIRFFIEGKRTDSLYLGNLKMAQLTSVVFLLIGTLGYLGLFKKFTKTRKPTLIFDFDGTLIDTSESIVYAYAHLFKKYATIAEFTPERKKEVIGPALKDLFPKYFPGQDVDKLIEEYRKAQLKVASKKNKVTPNTAETLKTLKQAGYNMAIVSTRNQEGIKNLLEENSLAEYINIIVGLNDVKNLKPNPEAIFKIVEEHKFNRDVVYIGDTMLDMGCANNYGAYAVAYLNNPEISQLMAMSANEAITDMSQLLTVLDKDINFTNNMH